MSKTPKTFRPSLNARLRRRLLLFFFLVALASGSVWIKTSSDLKATQPADQAFLYPGAWQLSNLQREDERRVRFEVRFFEPSTDQLISQRARLLSQSQTPQGVTSFEFTLEPDDNWFTLQRGSLKNQFHLSFAPADRYSANNNSKEPEGFVSVGLIGTRVSSGSSTSVQDWVATYPNTSIPADLHLPDGSGEPVFAVAATRYFTWLEDKQGWPDDKVLQANVNEAFDLVDRGKSKIWCGNIANLYMLLSQRMGLSSRPIMLMNVDGNSIATGGHVANETYLSSVAHWQLIDFTLGVFRVTGVNGVPLNVFEFHQMMSVSGADLDNLVFDVYDPDHDTLVAKHWIQLPIDLQVQLRSFYGVGVQLFYRFHPTVGIKKRTFVYRVANKLFDLEKLYMLGSSAVQVSALTWYDVRGLCRIIFLISCTLLLFTLASRRRDSILRLSSVSGPLCYQRPAHDDHVHEDDRISV